MSLFSKIVSLRDEFRKRANANLNFTDAVIQNDVSLLSGSVSGAINNNVYYVASNIDDYVNIRFKSSSDDDLILEIPDTSLLEQYADRVIDSTTNLTVNDAINGVVSSYNLYDILESVTGRYAYLNRQKFTDIATLLTTNTATATNSLLQALSHGVDNEGFISINSFFSIIKSYFDAAKEGADSGSPELDDSNPYKSVDIMSIALDVLQTIWTGLMLVLQGVFRVIALIISVIMSFFSQAIKGLQNKTHAAIDYNQGNLFVEGPVLAYESRDDSEHGIIPGAVCYRLNDEIVINERNHVYYQENSGIGLFSWLSDFDQESVSSQTRYNAYLYPCINVEKIGWRHLFQYEVLNNANHIKIYFNTDTGRGVQDPDSKYYVSLSGDMDDWPVYSETEQPSSAFFALFSVAFTWFIRWIRYSKQCIDMGSGSYGPWSFQAYFETDDPTADVFKPENGYDWVQCMLAIIANALILGPDCDSGAPENSTGWYKVWHYGDSRDEQIKNLFVDKLEENFPKHLRDVIMPYNDSPVNNYTYFNGDTAWVSKRGILTSGPDVLPKFDLILVGSAFMPAKKINNSPYLVLIPIDANFPFVIPDCLPIKCGLKFPELVTSEVITAIAVVALSVAAISIAAIAIKARITRMNVAKRTLKADNIAKLRQDYLNDPTNVQAKLDYENAVYKYNLFGSMFGYGTYDGRNGWFDSASSGGNSLEQISLDNILGSASSTEDKIVTTNSNVSSVGNAVTDNSRDILLLLGKIKNLIKV